MLYKDFNRIFKKIILITLISCRIIAEPSECLTLCCPCFKDEESNSKNEESNSKNEESKSKDVTEIKLFFKKPKPQKNYKKEKIILEKSRLEPTLENYIEAFNDIDKRLGSFFKDKTYKFKKESIHNSFCIFDFFIYEKKIKDFLQIGDYCVTFDKEKENSSFIKDLNEALLIKEDNELKYYSDDIKKFKENYFSENINPDNEGNKDLYLYLNNNSLYIYSMIKNKYIGGIDFNPFPNNPSIFNIAYWLNYNYRGLGIMSVIVPTICKYLFTRIKEIKGFSFLFDKGNSKSAGLAEKICKFICTGHEQEYEIKKEQYPTENSIEINKKIPIPEI